MNIYIVNAAGDYTLPAGMVEGDWKGIAHHISKYYGEGAFLEASNGDRCKVKSKMRGWARKRSRLNADAERSRRNRVRELQIILTKYRNKIYTPTIEEANEIVKYRLLSFSMACSIGLFNSDEGEEA